MNRQLTRLALVAVALLVALVVATTYWQTWAAAGLQDRQDNAIQRVVQFTVARGLIEGAGVKTLFATMLEPPYETSGSVIPVNGMTRRMPPTMMNVCSANPNVRPAASSFEKPSPARSAIRKPRSTNTM